MKSSFAISLLLIMTTQIYAVELEHVATNERLNTTVLKVISIVDDGFEYTSYEIEYKGIRTTVSPILPLNKYKTGDPIEVMIMKLSQKNTINGSTTKTMTFSVMPSFTELKNEDENNPFK
jgi:hypothetical protein